MLNNFFKYLEANIDLSEETASFIRMRSIFKKVPKRRFLLQEGDILRYHIFVSKGILRMYRVDDRGLEHILKFSAENSWMGDAESMFGDSPSNYSIDAIEDTEVVMISKENFTELIAANADFAFLANDLFQRNFIESQNRILFNISLSSEEKYLDFLQTYPELPNRIPQHMIASFLGLTAETLSRIKTSHPKK